MNIKQLKADYQLAELRLKSDESEKNQAIFKQAKKEYESALKSAKSEPVKSDSAKAVEEVHKQGEKQLETIKKIQKLISPKIEVPKIEPLSVENQNSDTSASTQRNGDASVETQQLPATTETSGDAGSEKEKKTEVNP